MQKCCCFPQYKKNEYLEPFKKENCPSIWNIHFVEQDHFTAGAAGGIYDKQADTPVYF